MKIKDCICFFKKSQKNSEQEGSERVLEDFSYWLKHYMIDKDLNISIFGISFLWTEKMTYKIAKNILTEINACNEELAYTNAEPKGVLLYQYKMRFILKCATIYQYMAWNNWWLSLIHEYVWINEGLHNTWTEGDELTYLNLTLNEFILCSYGYKDIVSFLEGIQKNE